MTIAPDRPGSIPILIIFSFKGIARHELMWVQCVADYNSKERRVTDMEILQLADQCGVVAVTKHEWDGKQFNHTDDYLDGDGAALVIFAKLIAQHEREACAKVCEQTNDGTPYNLAEACAVAIRARGHA
jgi:hypothetical protein